MMVCKHTMRLRAVLAGVAMISTGLGMTGCNTFKQRVGDHSLDYTQTRRLAPIELPADAQTLPFTPLYQVPAAGTNTLKLANATGTRFDLPAPISSVRPQAANAQTTGGNPTNR